MSDCIFCKIAQGKIPTQFVYSDEHTVVFKDLSPKAPVHLLAVPRQHYACIQDIEPLNMDIMAKLMAAVSQVVKQEKLSEKGYRLVVNSGADAGQVVRHIHVHILGGAKLSECP